jgi:hypothetical protein
MSEEINVALGNKRILILATLFVRQRVFMDTEKVYAMLDWSIPMTVKALQWFLGLTWYYRKFIRHYEVIASPSSHPTSQGRGLSFGHWAFSTYDKDLLDLFASVQKWRPHLLGQQFTVKTDQCSLKYVPLGSNNHHRSMHNRNGLNYWVTNLWLSAKREVRTQWQTTCPKKWR